MRLPALPRTAHGLLAGVHWLGALDNGRLLLIDQTALPARLQAHQVVDLTDLIARIRDLTVRGAPAIALAAAYGLVLHVRGRSGKLLPACRQAATALVASRPTAVNLSVAMARMVACAESHAGLLTAHELVARLLMEARRIHREDAAFCAAIAQHGAALLPRHGGVLTHCHTGALATGGDGTALGAIVAAVRGGAALTVYADETRPLLQGARLTAWELLSCGVDVRLATDSMAGSLMARGLVQAVIVGADRIAANGDTANKIGTYGLAVLARFHRIPFYVAAPTTSFDPALANGDGIVIEERHADEVRQVRGVALAPLNVPVVNPAFDVTPGTLITALITERGVVRRPTRARVLAHLARR